MKSSSSHYFRVPAILIALSIIPILAGMVRVHGVVAGELTTENARFFMSPIPIIFHIITASFFCILGAFQFPQYYRHRWPNWHRLSGRALIICGLASALSGLWMTLFYPIPSPLQGNSLYYVRILVGCAMSASIVLALISIMKRDVSAHRAWVIRAYALGQGAGTQVLVFIPFMIAMGEVTGFLRDMLMISAWVINSMIAELIIWRSIISKQHYVISQT
ncbi:MAG: DUF2306 domain-containing protein [Agitococcus sp.]|nr:DUF2306 domain-containing protein [Agitococcus sp.]